MGQRHTTLEEEAAERDVAARWGHDKALRAEFADDRAACVAYHKAIARGARPFVGRSTAVPAEEISNAPADNFAPAAGHQARASAKPAPAPAPAPAGVPEGDVERALRRRWDASAQLRAEYADDFKLFAAFEKANAAGRVRILGARTTKQPGESPAAAASHAAPSAASPDAPIDASVRYGAQEFYSFNDFYAWRRTFAAKQIAQGKLDEAEFRANMVERWNTVARTQGGK
jgi:hypothetical protein